MTTPLTRHDVLADEKQQPYFLNTLKTVAEERQSGITIYPPQKTSSMRFALLNWAMSKSSFSAGPLSRPGQAHGLAFSVRPGVAIPPSLLNMYKELEATIPGFTRPPRLSRKLGTTGRAAAEYGPDRPRRTGALARQSGLGDLYR